MRAACLRTRFAWKENDKKSLKNLKRNEMKVGCRTSLWKDLVVDGRFFWGGGW